MSSVKQLNVFEENKLQALPKEDLPEPGYNVERKGRLYFQPSGGQRLWQAFQYEMFLRYRLPARLYLDEVIETVKQRHVDYYRRLGEQQRRLSQEP